MIDIERDIIRKFRVTSKYKGYFLIIDALQTYIEMYYQNNSISMSGNIYSPLAVKYNTTVFCVEHNIRTLIERCWNNNRAFMEEIFGITLNCCPSNRDFIDSVAYYVISANKKED